MQQNYQKEAISKLHKIAGMLLTGYSLINRDELKTASERKADEILEREREWRRRLAVDIREITNLINVEELTVCSDSKNSQNPVIL